MSRHTYIGTVQGQVYPDYRDLETGSTLVAELGRTYDITGAPRELPNADGELVPVELPVPPPDGRWTDPEPERKPKKSQPAAVPADTSEETG